MAYYEFMEFLYIPNAAVNILHLSNALLSASPTRYITQRLFRLIINYMLFL